jgi:predicted dehydrogenase
VTVGWGFLGAGRIARHLAWEISQVATADVVAVGGSSVERAASLGVGRPGRYDAVLADPAVEVVYVALANHLHLPWTLRALEAGKHVLCEKPLGLTAAEVTVLSAAAGDRLLVEALMWRWHPRALLAAQRLREIGPIEHVSAGFCFGGVGPDDYRRSAACGGGASLDVGVYPVSAALWAAGPVMSVSARSRGGPVDLATSYLLEHVSGATSQLEASMDDRAAQWLVVTGRSGEVELRGDAFTGGGELLVSDGSSTSRVVVDGSGYRAMVEAVSTRVHGGDGWVLPLAESLAVAEVLDAARASAGSVTPVAVRLG